MWVRKFILYHNKRHPSSMGAAEVNAFLTSLATEYNVAASTQNQGTECADLSLSCRPRRAAAVAQ
jgi:hypothetical protein